jgi:predicted transcriptional regulator
VLSSKLDIVLAMEQTSPLVALRGAQYAKACRLNGWITQAQQARAFGHSAAYISRLIRGKTDVTADFIAAVLEALPDSSFEDLFELVTEADLMSRRAS